MRVDVLLVTVMLSMLLTWAEATNSTGKGTGKGHGSLSDEDKDTINTILIVIIVLCALIACASFAAFLIHLQVNVRPMTETRPGQVMPMATGAGGVTVVAGGGGTVVAGGGVVVQPGAYVAQPIQGGVPLAQPVPPPAYAQGVPADGKKF